MLVEGEYLFQGPRSDVYEMFNDPHALAKAVPGMQKLTQTDETHYEGVMRVQMGPVNATFTGILSLTDVNPPESCVLNIEGKGAAGFAHGSGKVVFIPIEENQTLLKYSGEANLGGTIASVGQRVIESVMKAMIKNGCKTLEKVLAERLLSKYPVAP